MFERDLLVSFIALALGLLMLTSAFVNYDKAFQLNTPQYLTQTLGRTGARLVMAFVGLFVVTLGVYILCTPLFKESHGLRNDGSQTSAIPESNTDGSSNHLGKVFPPLVSQ